MFAYYVDDLSLFFKQFSESFGLRLYSVAYVLAFASAYGICLYLARQGSALGVINLRCVNKKFGGA